MRDLRPASATASSYVLQQGKIRFVLTTPLRGGNAIAEHVGRHGDGVKVIALWVDDAAARGARPRVAAPSAWRSPTSSPTSTARSCCRASAPTAIRFTPSWSATNYSGAVSSRLSRRRERSVARPTGLIHIDHMVGNVGWHEMDEWVKFYANVMGFSLYQHFDDKDISTEYSALMSKVMANGNGYVKFPINEPAEGKKKSQIEEYLEFYGGPGVQHIALATNDILHTVSKLSEQGIEFLHVPHTYYTELQSRVGTIDEPSMSWRGSASWSIAITKATCCRSSRVPWRIGPRCSSRSFSARAAAASAKATSRRSSKPSSASSRHAEICSAAEG